MAGEQITNPAPEVIQPTQTQATAAPTAPAVQAPPSSGGPDAGTAAGGQAAQAQSQQALSVVQALQQQYGLDLGVQDDHAALARLVQYAQLAQQNHQLAQYGREYVQHAEQFNAWKKQQEEAARQQQQQRQGWWKAPEYDPSWANKILRDQNGQLVAAPGADPGIVNKYLAWVDHQRQVMDRLAQDPLAVIQPGLEQLIDQRAQQIVQQHLQAQQEQYTAKSFVQQNAGWIYQKDQAGNPIVDPRAFTPAGQRFAQYVQQAEQLGLTTQAQMQYAMGMTQRDVMYAQLAAQTQQTQQTQAPAVDPAQAANAAFLQQAAQNAQRTQQAAVQHGAQPQTNGQPPPVRSARDLQQAMLADFAAAGISPNQPIF